MEFKIDPNEFNIDFMKENGYVRKKCIKCGAYFWTPNPDQEVCGETPCVDYEFLGKPPTRGRYTVSEMRRLFLKFFEKNGHEIIDPYPVVARWRDDLLVTIASIADFQPYVTAGLAEPPANPLVVSQPCLRFEDILNVGLTAGRHLTIFEMGGAHAFNRTEDGKFLYWKDGTIAYHHEFATSELGIPGDLITYKEHFWVGGGNAGPDVEGIVKGLEVSTLVFMMYEIVDNKLIQTPILTVDTGYGIERWAWLSQGAPSAFHTIYGPVLNWIMDEVGLSIEDEVLYDNTLYSPMYDASKRDEVIKLRRKIAKKHGYDPDELINKLSLFDELSILLDHSKAAIFLIKDGAIPSNVKEGYLTRMLLRKIFRLLSMRGLEGLLEGLFKRQIDYWGRDFRDVKEAENVIFEVLSLEREKYRSILNRLPTIIRRYKKKYGGIETEHLIEIYDSHGISPEMVAEYLKRSEGIEIKIPSDFYRMVSERHMKSSAEPIPTLSSLSRYETTELFYRNQYWKSMTARVLHVEDNSIILDKTVFYPEGGGQVGDTGVLKIDGSSYRVVNTVRKNGVILHIIDGDVPKDIVGKTVEGVIDWDRRLAIMRHHTSTHVLLGAIRRVLGGHIWQAGAEKRPEIAHIDVTHYKLPTPDEIRLIEKLANEIVSRNIQVEINWMDRGAAEKKYGVRIYQGGMVPGKKLRILKIGDWDVEACGGTHVSNTGELMYIKITSVDKIHDGVIRFNYVAGTRAIELSRKDQDILDNLSKLLSVSRDNVYNAVLDLMRDREELEKEFEKLMREYIDLYGEKLYSEALEVNGLKYIFLVDDDVEKVIKIGEALEKRYNDVFFVGVSRKGRGINIMVFVGSSLREKGLDAYKTGVKAVKDILKGGGKGDSRYARFGGRFSGEIESIKEVFLEVVKEAWRV